MVLKFFSPRCISCKAIKPKFDRLVRANSDALDFYEVDHFKARAFCKQCDVNFMPATHVYHGGELLRAMSVGSQSFGEFTQLVQELANGYVPPDSASAVAS